jgi:hypothetical protein
VAVCLTLSSELCGWLLLVIGAAATGVLVAGAARWQGAGRLGASLAGFGGPALVAASYLAAGPADRTAAPLDEPYLASVYAVAAGLFASVLVAMPGRRAPRPARPAPAPLEQTEPLTGDVLEVLRGTASATSQKPARPSWAQGSGPYASAARTAAAQPAHATVPAAAPTGGQTAGRTGGSIQSTVSPHPVVPARPVTAAAPAVATGTASVPTYTGTASVPTYPAAQAARRPGWDGDTMVHAPEPGGVYASSYVATVYEPPSGRHAAPD